MEHSVNHTQRLIVDTEAMDQTTHDPLTYGGRLGIAIEAAQLTVREVAKHLDVSPQSVYKVLRGESKTLQVANHLRVCKFLCIEPKWLSDGLGAMSTSRAVALEDNPDYTTIKTIKMSFTGTGYEIHNTDDASRPVIFRTSWLTTRGFDPKRLIAMRVEGPSMEPTLYEDDVVVINMDDTTPKNGDVYATRQDDELVIRRFFREAGAWWLQCDNADQRRHPKREASGQVIGRVVHRQSERL
jgi:phage repressor protein C with HTH and peptisase S24 domain